MYVKPSKPAKETLPNAVHTAQEHGKGFSERPNHTCSAACCAGGVWANGLKSAPGRCAVGELAAGMLVTRRLLAEADLRQFRSSSRRAVSPTSHCQQSPQGTSEGQGLTFNALTQVKRPTAPTSHVTPTVRPRPETYRTRFFFSSHHRIKGALQAANKPRQKTQTKRIRRGAKKIRKRTQRRKRHGSDTNR